MLKRDATAVLLQCSLFLKATVPSRAEQWSRSADKSLYVFLHRDRDVEQKFLLLCHSYPLSADISNVAL